MATERVYLGHDNVVEVQLLDEREIMDLSSVTRMTIDFADTIIDSAVHTDVFDWSAGNGVLRMALGAQALTVGPYMAQLVVYDPENTNGAVWGRLDILVT